MECNPEGEGALLVAIEIVRAKRERYERGLTQLTREVLGLKLEQQARKDGLYWHKHPWPWPETE